MSGRGCLVSRRRIACCCLFSFLDSAHFECVIMGSLATRCAKAAGDVRLLCMLPCHLLAFTYALRLRARAYLCVSEIASTFTVMRCACGSLQVEVEGGLIKSPGYNSPLMKRPRDRLPVACAHVTPLQGGPPVGGHGDVFGGGSPWTVTGPLFILPDLLVPLSFIC